MRDRRYRPHRGLQARIALLRATCFHANLARGAAVCAGLAVAALLPLLPCVTALAKPCCCPLQAAEQAQSLEAERHSAQGECL